MKWALVDSQNIVQNIISYDGVSPFQPQEGQILIKINDWVNLGDNININEPTIIDNLSSNFTIEQRRGFVITALTNERDFQIQKNITVNGHIFLADNDSITVLHQALTIQGLGIDTIFPTNWILADGTILNVSYDNMKAVATSISMRKSNAYTNYITLASKINSSQTPENIDITQGWPE